MKNVTSGFGKISTGLSGLSNKIKETFSGNNFEGAKQGATSLIGSLKGIAIALGGITAATAGINIASNFSEETGKLEFAFGEQSEMIKSFIEGLDEQYGIGIVDTTSFVAKLGTKLKGLGVAEDELGSFAQSVTKMSMDMAEAFHLDPSDMSDVISQALTGQTRALKQFGIIIDEAQLKKELFGKGIDFENLSEADKATVMLNELNKQLSKTGMKGFRENMLGSFETSLESVQNRLKDMTALTFQPLTQALAEPLMNFSNLLKDNKQLFINFGTSVSEIIKKIFDGTASLQEPFAELFENIANFVDNLNLGEAFNFLAAIIKDGAEFMIAQFNELFSFVTENSEGFKNLFIIIGDTITFLMPIIKTFVSGFVEGFKIILGAVNLFLEGLFKVYEFLGKIFKFISNSTSDVDMNKITEGNNGIYESTNLENVKNTDNLKNTENISNIDNSINNMNNFANSSPIIPEKIIETSPTVNNSNTINMSFQTGTDQELVAKIKTNTEKTIEEHNRQKELQYGVI